MRVGRTVVASALFVLAACSRGENALAQENRAQQQVQSQLGQKPAVIDTSLASRLSATFRGAAERALPAVVYIRVQSRTVASARRPNIPGIPPGLIPPDFFGAPDDAPQTQVAAGSGFIYDPRGYILTNNHVVADATQVTVTLVDGQVYDAKVIGRDPNTDVAVIQITPHNSERMPTVQLGNSDGAQVGDWVIALGNPLGLNFTVTAGIISAKGRNIGIIAERQGPSALESYIQTDAAINPGNSGGPLVDLAGRVIAINSAIESPTGTFVGAGFAIPINLAVRVASDLVRYGAVHRPRLGVSVGDVNEADASAYGLPSVSGALVRSVQPSTPAAAAGLQPGDVIVSVNGQRVASGTDLTTRLAEMQPGQTVDLTIYRNRRQQQVQVRLGEFEAERAATTAAAGRPNAAELLGFTVAPLTADIAQQLHFNRASGVVITSVSPLSPAAGLVARGQLIVSINGQNVNTVADVERVAGTLRSGEVVSLRLLDPQLGMTVANFRLRG